VLVLGKAGSTVFIIGFVVPLIGIIDKIGFGFISSIIPISGTICQSCGLRIGHIFSFFDI